jgi:TPR repeat protein
MIKRTILALALAMSSASALANTGALNELFHASEAGDVVAQIQLGNLYASGDGELEQSYAEALRWFTAAGDNGLALAQYNAAVLYEQGLGTEQSISQAIAWYQRAAEQGHTGAQLNLGYLYEHGIGVDQSYSKAYELYAGAAENGDPIAQHNLGLMLVSDGMGTPRHEEAFELFLASAKSGYTPAQYSVGLRYLNGLGTELSGSEGINWLARAAQDGNAPAQHQLGEIYSNGQYVKPSAEWATHYYSAAANQGHTESEYKLARLYMDSDDKKSDYHTITTLLTKAAQNDHKEAYIELQAVVSNWKSVELQNTDHIAFSAGGVPTHSNGKTVTVYQGPDIDGTVPVVALNPLAAGSTSQPDAPAKVQTASIEKRDRVADKQTQLAKPEVSASDNETSTAAHTPVTAPAPSNRDSLAPGVHSVRRGPINLREGAATWFARIGQVEQGDLVEVIEDVGHGWARIKLSDSEEPMYMMSRVLDPVE